MIILSRYNIVSEEISVCVSFGAILVDCVHVLEGLKHISDIFLKHQGLFQRPSSSINTADIEKMDEECIKKENYPKSVKSEMIVDIKDEPGPLWEGELRFKSEERSEEIRPQVKIFHKDDSKNGCKLFDWTSQGNEIGFF